MKQIIYTFLVTVILYLIPSCVEDPQIPDDIRNALPPEVATGEVPILSVTATTATATGTMGKKNGAPVTVCGFIWGTTNPVTFENMKDSIHTPLQEAKFTSIVAGLTNNTVYYIAAFAGNVAGNTVGSSKEFKTKEGLGTMKTLAINMDSVKAESAIVGGRITDPGESAITKRGVYYWQDGTTLRDTVWSTMQTDSFTCRLIGLTPSTKYFVQAIAVNVFGTIEGGTAQEFTTPDGKSKIASFQQLFVDYTFADFKATVSKEGDAPVTARGFCYAVVPTPYIENDTILCGEGAGEFTGRIKNLQANTTYYVKAYAVNAYGVTYSDVTLEVTTKNEFPTLVLNTAELTATPGTLKLSGEVKDQGDSNLTTVGICWSTSTQAPVPGTDNVQSFSSAVGVFSGDVAGFKGGQTYYLRAYATNASLKTSYSKMVSITTPSVYKEVVAFSDGTRTFGSATSFMINTSAYFFGGDTGPSYTGKLWQYSDMEGLREMGACPEKLSWMSAVSVNLAAFVLGGRDDNNQLTNNFYNYSGTQNHWTKLTIDENGPTAVARTFGTLLDMKLYYIGGIRKNETSEYVSGEVWQYNVNSGVWIARPAFPEPQYGGISFTYNNVMYSGFGITSLGTMQTYTKKLMKSTDAAGSWEQETTMPGGNVIAAVVHKNLLYVVDDARYIWYYNFTTKEWKQMSQVPSQYYPVHAMYSIGDYIYMWGLGTSKKLITYNPVWDL